MTGPGAAPATIGSVRRDLARRLGAVWGDNPERTAELDAKLLLAHALGLDPTRLTFHERDPVRAQQHAAAVDLVERRLAGEPVARILGTKEFWGLDFVLSPATLVPRPDTETLVSAALDAFVASGRREAPLRLLDLGTGTGCILLSLLSELTNATGLGIDRSAEAVETAGENARRLGFSGRARFVAGNWADGIVGPYDGILSNPPYINDNDLAKLAVEVADHDPHLALAGGVDGLDPYRIIIPVIPRLLAPAGLAVLEFGPGQATPIAQLAAAAGLRTMIRQDLAGRDRAAILTGFKED